MIRTVAALVILSLWPVMASSASGTKLPHGFSQSQYIINGTPVARSARSPVVGVVQLFQRGYSLCSGSVISPKAVLTASHCVVRSPRRMAVALGGGRIAKVGKVRINPRVRELKSGLLRGDVAVLFLKKPTSRPPIGLLVSRAPQVNDELTLLGVGKNNSGIAGILEQGKSFIAGVTRDFIVTIFLSNIQSSACIGDSGGPAIFGYSDSRHVRHSGIVGLVSEGTTTDCSIGTNVFYTNIQSPSVLNFITSRVRSVRLE